jgi:hypothetical protein
VIDRNTVVVGVAPRIGMLGFKAALDVALSPARFEAEQIYNIIVAQKVDPAFLLAIFRHESMLGLSGLAVANKNPGNTRSSLTDKGIVVDTPKGKFVRYPTWTAGFEDLAVRLVAPYYVYGRKGLVTIGQIIPVFAPDFDGNDPEAYIGNVVKLMNTWVIKEKGGGNNNMTAIPSSTDIGFPVRVHWAADVGPDRTLDKITWFVVHDTEGGMGGDEYVLTSADAPVESCHALIAPDGTLVFTLELTKTAWTPGNDYVAQRSINVELSGFQSKGYTDAQYKSLAAFFVWCLKQGCSIPATYVAKSGTAGIIGHQDVPNPNQPGKFGGASGHTDPGPLFDWNKFIRYIKEAGGGGAAPDYDPCMDYFNAHGGEAVFGKPIGGQHGSTPGAVEREFEFCHMYLDKATGKVIAQMKDRTNPQRKDVGPGVIAEAAKRKLQVITDEQYFTAEKPELGKRSFTWARDIANGVVYIIIALQLSDTVTNKPGDQWEIKVVREV